MTLPGELTEPMSWIGLEWPQADEDRLREAGQTWIDFGLALPGVAEPASVAAGQAWSMAEGRAAEAFETWWTGDAGPQHRLSDDAKAALLIGGALLAFAAITLVVKLSIIAQLASLALLVAQAVVTAFFTLGAGALEIGAFVAATRLAVRKLLRELVTHVQTVIREILENARALLRRGMSLRRTTTVSPSVRHQLVDRYGLDEDDLKALEDYTGFGYVDMNTALRSGDPLSPDLERRIDAVSRALAKLPPYQGTVFRGAALSPEQIAAYRPGEVITHLAFDSTTTDQNRVFSGNVRFFMESISGKDISHYSWVPDESEVLFDRGTTFQIASNDFDASSGLTSIYLSEVLS